MRNTHVADWLPKPLQIATKMGVHFSESLYSYKDKMRIQRNFYLAVSELLARQYGQYSPWRLNWPYCLAGNSESGNGWRLSERCTPNFLAICKGWGSPSATFVLAAIYGACQHNPKKDNVGIQKISHHCFFWTIKVHQNIFFHRHILPILKLSQK